MGRREACYFAVLLTLLAHAGITTSDFLLRGEDPWSESDLVRIVHRARREANKTDGDSDAATRCVIKNLKDIEQKLDKALPPERNASKAAALAKPHQIFSNADTLTLEKFCTIYKTSRSRLAGCGESRMKSFAAKALAVVDFICIDRFDDFVNAFPCIQKVDRILDAECQKNCSEYESAAEKLNSAGAAIVKKYTPSEIKELFAQSCLYVSCFMDCQKPMLETKCGAKVLDLEMSSISVTFKNLDDMMSQSSAAGVWPRECKPLNSMGRHAGKETAPAPAAPQPANSSSHDNSTLVAQSGSPAPVPSSPLASTIPPSSIPKSVKITNSTSLPVSANVVAPSTGNATARARSRAIHKN